MRFLAIIQERVRKGTKINVYIKGGAGPFHGVVVSLDENDIVTIRDDNPEDKSLRYSVVDISEIAAVEDDL